MKAIILAAGRGERMRPLTDTTPKPMIKVLGRPILDYVFDALPGEIDEVIVVVKYLSDQIFNFLGREYRGKKIHYAQGSDKGTAYSFLAAKDFLKPGERFLLLHGDEFPERSDVEAVLKEPLGIIVFEYEFPKKAGVAQLDEDGYIIEIEEKPEFPKGNLVAGGIMVLTSDIFNYTPRPNAKGEYFFSSMVSQFAKGRKLKGIFSDHFMGDVTTLSDIPRIEKLIMYKQ